MKNAIFLLYVIFDRYCLDGSLKSRTLMKNINEAGMLTFYISSLCLRYLDCIDFSVCLNNFSDEKHKAMLR